MTFEIKPDPLPLTRLPDGTIRVAGTRIGLDLIIYAFNAGHTPEQIVDIWETLSLADVYALLGFYLRHRDEVDEYVRWYYEEGERVRKEIEAQQGPPRWTREDLEARLRERNKNIASTRD
jgi:uncharacterized protein (DUF433 family)